MMNRLREVVDTLNKVDDLYVLAVKEDEATFILNDFVGFDENWYEIHRKYREPQLVDELLDLLKPYMNKEESDLYEVYELPNFTIILGYTSFDI